MRTQRALVVLLVGALSPFIVVHLAASAPPNERRDVPPRAPPGLVPRPSAPPLPALPTLPDLVVENCKLYCVRVGDTYASPPLCPPNIDPAVHGTVEIRGTVRNAGAGGTFPGGVITDTLLDADPSTAALGTNRSASAVWMPAGHVFHEGTGWFAVAIPASLPVGQHTATVRTDPRQIVPEGNEGNNSCSVSFNRIVIVPPTDVEVTAVTVSPSSGPPEAPFKFTVTVRNAAGPTAPDFYVTCDRTSLWTKVSGLALNQSRELVFPLSPLFPPGNRTVTCTADKSNQVVDNNRTNNQKSVTFTVTEP